MQCANRDDASERQDAVRAGRGYGDRGYVVFDFTQTPLPFKTVASRLGARYFSHEMKHTTKQVDS